MAVKSGAPALNDRQKRHSAGPVTCGA